MQKILIVGATSAIAEATARIFVQRGDHLFLVGRNPEKLERIRADLEVRGSSNVMVRVMDVNCLDAHASMIAEAEQCLGGLDSVLIAHGILSDQAVCQTSVAMTMADLHTNALSVISLLTLLANRFESCGYGVIAVISSVAGDRGRQSNYVYGTAKAAISTFLSGLRQRLVKSGVRVIIIKPGFVDTPMTANCKKGMLWAKSEDVARGIVAAIDRGSGVVYLPWFWRAIMFVVIHIPDKIFTRLKL